MEFVPKISDPPLPGTLRPITKELRIEKGARIFQRFTLISELGKGRCSTTWLADDPRFRREVALKLFRSANVEQTEEERLIWRDFLRRLRILNHPDIVITMEFFHEGPWLALSNSYEMGPSLAAMTLQAGKTLPLLRTLEILKTTGCALAAAHDKHFILHGNLNAWNILIPTHRRTAKITDFGFHPPLTPPGEDTGSPEETWKLACLSPERLAGSPPSHADDIYAFATVAFQLFTGKNPPLNASGDLDHAAAQALLSQAPAEWRTHLPIGLSTNPADRPETLTIFLQALNIYEEFRPLQKEIEKVQARAPKTTPRTSHSPDNLNRKKKILFQISVGICVIAAPLAVGWIIYHSTQVSHRLQVERVKAEVRERELEAAENERVLKLNDRLGGGADPSKSNLELYSRTMNEAAPTPKPTPIVINSGARDFYNEGRAKFAAGDPAGAMESYELAIVLQPDWPDLLEARGQALLANKKPEDAILEFSKALIIDPSRLNSLLGRAEAHLATGDKTSAKADLLNALKLDPVNADAKALIDKNNLPVQSEPGLIQ
ncbi:MAG: protein kinase [Chthoniobacterales bacterium]